MKIKRILSMVLALVLSIGAMSITAFAAEETMYGIGFVNASSLRLRSEPNASSATLVYAPRNDCVAVIGKTGECLNRSVTHIKTKTESVAATDSIA